MVKDSFYVRNLSCKHEQISDRRTAAGLSEAPVSGRRFVCKMSAGIQVLEEFSAFSGSAGDISEERVLAAGAS